MRSSARMLGAAPERTVKLQPRRWGAWQAMRPHQWIKNVLLFVPLAAVHGLSDPHRMAACLLGFVAFCLGASSIYLFNDLTDLAEDRSRPQTATRALASGVLSVRGAILLQGTLLALALSCAWMLPRGFLWVLGGYYLLMCAYSLALKRALALDVLVLATGYSLRVAAGAVVVGIHPSPWLIALCSSLFMSLALLKRYAELKAVQAERGPEGALRGYVAADAPMLAMQGIASGYVTVLILALYTTLVKVSYTRADLFWLLCALLLYWINYIWLLARRGRLPHDPVFFTLREPVSALLIGAMGLVALLAV